uniref:Uncharacterized protein n=1 Tax=Neurospora crassa TaxID=5141 RepID=Q6MFE2_NEUCS|nr:hypothetical protein [Neurospora crassa]
MPPFAPILSVIRITGCAQDCGRLHFDATRGGPIEQRPTSSNVIARKGASSVLQRHQDASGTRTGCPAKLWNLWGCGYELDLNGLTHEKVKGESRQPDQLACSQNAFTKRFAQST